MSQQILAKVEASSLKSEVPQFAIGDTVEVEIRDKKLKAKVVKPNFVRHGKSLLQEKLQ